MSSPLGQPSQSSGFQLPARSTRAGGDPDGVVDNRPGIAHPSLSRTRAKTVREAQHGYRDHYARAANNSSERINQSAETTRDTDRQKDLMVGVSLRAPRPIRKTKRKRRGGSLGAAEDDTWDSEWSWTSDDSIEIPVDPDASER